MFAENDVMRFIEQVLRTCIYCPN